MCIWSSDAILSGDFKKFVLKQNIFRKSIRDSYSNSSWGISKIFKNYFRNSFENFPKDLFGNLLQEFLSGNNIKNSRVFLIAHGLHPKFLHEFLQNFSCDYFRNPTRKPFMDSFINSSENFFTSFLLSTFSEIPVEGLSKNFPRNSSKSRQNIPPEHEGRCKPEIKNFFRN